MKYPKPLPNDQIIELLKKWQKDGDLEARNRVVEHNIGLCFVCAHKISNMQDSEDVAMSGVIGLIKACDDFDVSRGLSFGNYAYFRISSECWRFKYTNNSVKIGSKAQIEAMAIKSGKKDMVDVRKSSKVLARVKYLRRRTLVQCASASTQPITVMIAPNIFKACRVLMM